MPPRLSVPWSEYPAVRWRPCERDDDAILRLLEDRGVQYTTWDGWMALDEHERSLGAAAVDADGEPRARIKVVGREEMVRVSREGAPQPTHA